MPSITGGTPIALLEAMQVKVPYIITNVNGMPDMLAYGHGGWIGYRKIHWHCKLQFQKVLSKVELKLKLPLLMNMSCMN